MTDWKLPWAGRCRCGETHVEVSKAPLLTAACHCTGYQTMSASAFSLSIVLPADGLVVTRGEPVLGGAGGEGQSRHHFCPRCKTWMFTHPAEADWIINIRPSILDDHGWFSPYVEFMTKEKLAWANVPATVSFEAFPEIDEYDGLIAGFAASEQRPASCC